MSIDLLRQDLRAWLDARINIQAWDLDTPANVPRVIDGTRYPANSAVEMPVENFTIQNQAGRTLATTIMPYVIVWRFNKDAAQDQLPVKQAEELLIFLTYDLVAHYGSISDLIETAQVLNSENPVRIGRTDGEDGDWLVAIYLELRITWVVEYILIEGGGAPDTILAPPIDLAKEIVPSQIGVGLNRAKVGDLDDSTLDQILTVLLGE